MTARSSENRPRWLAPAIGFLVGVLFGWWVLGWLIWPVSWKNTLPADLRAQERNHYLTMVAESFALNGDVNEARARLASWPPSEQVRVLKELYETLSSSQPQRARLVQSLLTSVVPGATTAAPTARPTARPATTAPTTAAQTPLWRQILTGLMWAVLFVLGIAAVIWLWRRWSQAQAARSGPAISPTALGRPPYGTGTRPAPPATPTPDRETEWAGSVREETVRPEPAITWRSPEPVSPPPPVERTAPAEPSPYAPPARPTQPPGAEPKPPAGPAVPPRTTPPSAEARPPSSAPRGTPAPAVGTAVKLGEYRAIYQMGEPDYDEAFDISDGSGAYVGQCGLELNDPVGRNRDQAAALRVWLWDSTDPDTQESVLMSEGAYRDTAMRDQLAAAGQTVVVTRPGAQFELETHQLYLRGSIERLVYAEQEPVNGIFAELHVRMQVYRKG